MNEEADQETAALSDGTNRLDLLGLTLKSLTAAYDELYATYTAQKVAEKNENLCGGGSRQVAELIKTRDSLRALVKTYSTDLIHFRQKNEDLKKRQRVLQNQISALEKENGKLRCTAKALNVERRCLHQEGALVEHVISVDLLSQIQELRELGAGHHADIDTAIEKLTKRQVPFTTHLVSTVEMSGVSPLTMPIFQETTHCNQAVLPTSRVLQTQRRRILTLDSQTLWITNKYLQRVRHKRV